MGLRFLFGGVVEFGDGNLSLSPRAPRDFAFLILPTFSERFSFFNTIDFCCRNSPERGAPFFSLRDRRDWGDWRDRRDWRDWRGRAEIGVNDLRAQVTFVSPKRRTRPNLLIIVWMKKKENSERIQDSGSSRLTPVFEFGKNFFHSQILPVNSPTRRLISYHFVFQN